MTRDIFVRVATTALRQNPGRSPEEQAEAIASLMDTVASVLGDAPPPVQHVASPPPPAFPRFNPEAIAPVPPAPETEQPLIIQATRIPDYVEPVAPMAASAPPVRSLRPSGRMKVEDLSHLIQERTPAYLTFPVPMGDGTYQNVTFQRNVISMHAFDSVKLTYYPAGARASVMEAVEVTAVLHIDDVPLDLPAIIKKLTAEAIESVRPKEAPREVPVRPFSGPVQPASAYPDGGSAALDQASTGQVQAAFGSIG